MDKLKERIHYIDIAKGIAMILVILGHVKKLVPNTVVWWLYSFHIPLFFILSGMVFDVSKYPKFKTFLWKKIKTLLIPYFILCLIGWVWTYIVRNPTDFINDTTLKKFIGIFLGQRGSKYYFSMWFLTALFISEILIYLYAKIIKNKKIFFITSIGLTAVAGSIIATKLNKGFYWSLDLVPSAMSFVLIGYFLKTYKKKFTYGKFITALIMIAMLGLNVLVAYLNYKANGRSDLYELKIGNPAYYYIAAVCGAIFVILFSKAVHKFSILEYIGRNSLIYYAYQKMLFITPLLVIFKTIAKHCSFFEHKSVQLCALLIITCAGLAVISETITKCFPWIIGKFPEIKFWKNKRTRNNKIELLEENLNGK